MEEGLFKKYIPMTETTYYTLLALLKPRHGYAIMQYVGELTENRIKLGTGTLYTMVGRLTEDKIIKTVAEDNGKKTYQITEAGIQILLKETKRLEIQVRNGKETIAKEGISHE